MVDTTTMSSADLTDTAPAARPARRLRPPRGLPAGRAVVGALLIIAAVVLTFAAYLDATAAPTVRYVVATASVEPGTRLDSLEAVGAHFGTIALDLPPEVAPGVIAGADLDDLIGQVVLAPLAPGDLLSRTQLLADGGVATAQTMSFAVPRRAAVAGNLAAGERIDVLATYGSGEGAYTAFVVRGVPLLRVAAPDGGALGDSGEVLLTVAVSALEDVQALGHAVATADVLVTRSTARAGDEVPAPGAYRPSADAIGPLPDPASWNDRSATPPAAVETDGAAADAEQDE